MSTDSTSSEVIHQYGAARDFVIGWEYRMARQEKPLPGSDLDSDDKALAGTVPSELASIALTSGTEALQLVRETLDRHRTYVSATNGPIRTALLAASHTVYQLTSDDADVRRERQRFAQRSYYSNMSAYFRERRVVEPDPYFETVIEGNTEKIDALDKILGQNKKGDPRKAESDTGVVREAAKTFGEPNAGVMRMHWRRLSGDAHALGWQLLVDGVQKQRTVGHMFEGTLAADEANTMRHFLTAATMLKRAWSLFDQRCSDD